MDLLLKYSGSETTRQRNDSLRNARADNDLASTREFALHAIREKEQKLEPVRQNCSGHFGDTGSVSVRKVFPFGKSNSLTCLTAALFT